VLKTAVRLTLLTSDATTRQVALTVPLDDGSGHTISAAKSLRQRRWRQRRSGLTPEVRALSQRRIQDLPKVGADHGERAEREPKQGSGGGAPTGVQGYSLKAFYPFT